MASETAETKDDARLPAQFRDLERFGAWMLKTESERVRQRLSSSMQELRVFYDAMLPQMADIGKYLNQFRLDELSAPARRLLLLALSFVEISSAVECYGQPRIPNSFDELAFCGSRN